MIKRYSILKLVSLKIAKSVAIYGDEVPVYVPQGETVLISYAPQGDKTYRVEDRW
ncbi:BnaA08g29700D [Brassica napus]|uniref:BnaA08g29700D protein n=1 Tax=Brassica napus TaxID=3708 RepID=A0A078JM87_BRANA|nr:BnaA08g29700D [Brassica napus]